MSRLHWQLNSDKVVALISMPFYIGEDVPNLAISMLKASLNKENIHCDNFYFDEVSKNLIGWSLYYLLSQLDYIGEWFFASSAFEGFDTPPPLEPSFKEKIQYNFEPDKFVNSLKKTHKRAEEIIESLYNQVTWDDYILVGFSTTFFQTTASLALARRIKARHPKIQLVFGGGNCDGIMGLTLHQQFPFIDYVIRGEGDHALPILAKRIFRGDSITDISGLIYRNEAGETIVNGDKSPTILDLDKLPIPNFDDYFNENSIVEDVNFPVQFSRGCWWGEKNQCVFCGLNGYSLEFRTKSADRIFKELDHLSNKYNRNRFQVVDNIFKPDFFKDLLPRIITERPNWSFFLEVKANLRKEQVKLLRAANARIIQPGIENLSNELLDSMNKGCSSIQNVQLLKWCSEYGIDPLWSFLSGFPNENHVEYKRMEIKLPDLIHLKPPERHNFVRLVRFSDMFERAEEFGLKNVRPKDYYKSVYPFSEEIISNLVYFFDFDYPDGIEPETSTRSFSGALKYWLENYAPGTLSSIEIEDVIHIFDNRPNKNKKKYEFSGIEKAVYDYCDHGHSFKVIHNHTNIIGFDVGKEQLREILNKWIQLGLIYSEGDWFVSLAVKRDEYINLVSDNEDIKLTLTEIVTELLNAIS